jgi:hypothetical protein
MSKKSSGKNTTDVYVPDEDDYSDNPPLPQRPGGAATWQQVYRLSAWLKQESGANPEVAIDLATAAISVIAVSSGASPDQVQQHVVLLIDYLCEYYPLPVGEA